ncbi:uncharacterized protein LOC111263819 isoform X3 [Varroa jacobsoni]|uniref:uncharacterized protein LOC111263819 isoform X3 n=1 Tax=Varroa jacobsoni TaxID=62625 RepID=UPI000BF85754|nr:uncharacterized protein LOC111263819 isoform X3 [Varroa jacobsoni]
MNAKMLIEQTRTHLTLFYAVHVMLVEVRCSEDPNFMEQVMPEVCIPPVILYRVKDHASRDRMLENAADTCFKVVQNLTGWPEMIDIVCAGDENRGSSSIKSCFSKSISEYLMFDARDVDKITRECRNKSPPEDSTVIVE